MSGHGFPPGAPAAVREPIDRATNRGQLNLLFRGMAILGDTEKGLSVLRKTADCWDIPVSGCRMRQTLAVSGELGQGFSAQHGLTGIFPKAGQ